MSAETNIAIADPEKRILYMDDDVVVVSKMPGEVCSFVDKEKGSDAPYLPDVFADAVAKAEVAVVCESAETGGIGGSGSGAESSATDAEKPFLECVHRIDRPVSGCVVMARNKKALANVSGQFTNHTTAGKRYWAIVEGVIPVSKSLELLENQLVFDTKKQKTYIVTEKTRKAKKAQLYWRCVGAGDRYSFLEVELLTRLCGRL